MVGFFVFSLADYFLSKTQNAVGFFKPKQQKVVGFFVQSAQKMGKGKLHFVQNGVKWGWKGRFSR